MLRNKRSIPAAVAGLFHALGTVILWCVIGSFAAATAVSILWKLDAPPIQGLPAAAAALPSEFYADLIRLEISRMEKTPESHSFSARNVTFFLTRLTTGVHPEDPRTIAAQLLPGGHGEIGFLALQGVGTNPSDIPVEVPPAPHLREITGSEPKQEEAEEAEEANAPEEPADHPPETPSPEREPPEPSKEESAGKFRVFVYHSHPTEAYLPYLDGAEQPNEAFSSEPAHTVIEVGAFLANLLNQKGLPTLHSKEYYNWETAYQESRQTVKAAMKEHASLHYFLDLHRDSAKRDVTVLEHNGTTYAKLFFVIGQKNPNFEQNQAFAKAIHDALEAKVSGLSRGIFVKKDGSNGEFNQSLSPNSLIIEVGGVENTMEESKRSIEVLAEVLADLYWDQIEAVRASADPAKAD